MVMKSKLTTLLRQLREVREADKTSKCLIFSQFMHTLEWLQEELPKNGFGFRTLAGSMSQAERHAMRLRALLPTPRKRWRATGRRGWLLLALGAPRQVLCRLLLRGAISAVRGAPRPPPVVLRRPALLNGRR